MRVRERILAKFWRALRAELKSRARSLYGIGAGGEKAVAGRDCRTRLARPNSQARTGTGQYLFSLFS